jgi:hypothetical protein
MVDDYNKNKIDDVKRINIRYYLIKIDGKSYIIDYANPKDIRTYFSSLFPYDKWKIYDVTEHETKYDIKNLFFHQTDKYDTLCKFIYNSYILNVTLFPKALNIWYVTKDSRIVQYWQFTIALIFLSVLLLFMVLYFQQTSIRLPKKSELLVNGHKSSMQRIILKRLVIPILLTLSMLWAITSSNYAHLLLFGVIGFCLVNLKRQLTQRQKNIILSKKRRIN